jgi:hypothetical protein
MSKTNTEFESWWTTIGKEKYPNMSLGSKDARKFKEGFKEAITFRLQNEIEIRQRLKQLASRISILEHTALRPTLKRRVSEPS